MSDWVVDALLTIALAITVVGILGCLVMVLWPRE